MDWITYWMIIAQVAIACILLMFPVGIFLIVVRRAWVSVDTADKPTGTEPLEYHYGAK